MRIVVDRVPDSGKDCLFAIHCDKWADTITLPNCILRMKGAFDWEYNSFSCTDNTCNCLKDLGKSCPYLAVEY